MMEDESSELQRLASSLGMPSDIVPRRTTEYKKCEMQLGTPEHRAEIIAKENTRKDILEAAKYIKYIKQSHLYDKTDQTPQTKALSISELRTIPEQKQEWLVDNFMRKGDIIVIGGDPGSFKSFLALILMLNIILGYCSFLIQNRIQNVLRRCKVLILDKENNPDRIKRRINKTFRGYNISEEARGYIWFNPDITLDKSQTQAFLDLCKFIELKEIKVLIIDSLVRFFSGQENSVDDVKEIYKTLRKLRDKYDLTIIVLHHTRKSNGIKTSNDLRGSSDILASMDSVFMLNKIKPNVYRISQHKNRDSENIEDITFNVVDKVIDGEDAIYLENATFESTKINSTIDSAKSVISSWIKDGKITDFRTKQVLLRHSVFHSKSAINSALDELVNEGSIVKLRQGRWKVREGGEAELSN
jgi:predicted ATP-dependent serine protease